jgi:hypothetical protein
MVKRSIRRSLDEFARRGETLDLDQRSGRAGWHDPTSRHLYVSGILPTVFRHFTKLLAQQIIVASSLFRGNSVMKKSVRSVALVALLVGVAGISTPSRAEVGQVAVVFTKGGFIIGVGGGEGVLVLRGKRYPFTVSGMSVGFTIGASTTKFVGRALNLKGPASIEGSYAVVGAGGAVAAGAGGVQLQNANGVILQLSGPRVGAEVSAAVGGVTIRLKG